jgi:hypothetical protein
MLKKLLNTKVKIETVAKKLSDDNLWISEYKFWNEVWASILIKDISSKRATYLFIVKWRRDFPRDFRVVVGNMIFKPTQSPILEAQEDIILFHAILN